MAAMKLAHPEVKRFDTPDETRSFPKGRLEFIHIAGGTVARFTVEPGWRWSEHIKPIAKTAWCEVPHFQYIVSGRMHLVMADGREYEVRSGDVLALPEHHDGWVVGDEPVIAIDWLGASNYAT